MRYRQLLWLLRGSLVLGSVGCSSSDGSNGGNPSTAGSSSTSHAGAGTTVPKGSGGVAVGSSHSGGTTSVAQGGLSTGGISPAAAGDFGLGGAIDTSSGTAILGGGGTSNNVAGAIGNGGWPGSVITGGASGRGGASLGGAAGSGTTAKGGSAAGGAAAGGAAPNGGSRPGGSTGRGGSATGSGASTIGGAGAGGAATGGNVSVAGSSSATDLPGAGNPEGACSVPAEAQLEDVSSPTHVVGDGTKESCSGAEFVKQVARGGIITFNCGPDPVTINLDETAKIVNDTGPKIVIDGGGKITLSGQDKVRILYQNTCDEAQKWTTDHCQNQDHPQLTVQNLTFVHGNAKSESGGGGAIFAQGGRLKIINSRFFNNVCADTGPDVGGAAVRAFEQYNGLPVYVVNSTFGGRDALGNVCSNGGGVGSIGVSWTMINSLFSYNQAIGNGGNPADPGTPGGGSGGSIYNDGDTMTLTLCGTKIEHNTVNAYGGAIFFVSNDHSGNISITDSVIGNNPGGSWYPNPSAPGISMHSDTAITIVNSTITL